MATASPHKKMMVLSLQQLEGNLLNLERDRANLITAIPSRPRTSEELPFEVLLREADQCCKEQGEILLYITRLTLTPGYYERPHRIQRLLYLLDSLMHCVDTVIDAAERLYADKSIKEWPKNQKSFILARRMLATGRDMIKIQHASNTSEDPGSKVDSANNASSDDCFTTPADSDMIDEIEYLSKSCPYTWASSAELVLRRPLHPRAGLPEPYIERAKAAYFIRYTSSSPIWEAGFLRDDFDCSSFNSVWQSDMTDHVFQKKGPTDYLRILNAIFSLSVDVSSYLYKTGVPNFAIDGPHSFQHPLTLAQGLRKLDVDVGYIFADEPSVIVWPLGKNAATSRGSVIIHCTRTCSDSNAWRYQALHPWEPENIGRNNARIVGRPLPQSMAKLQTSTAVPINGSSSSTGAINTGKNFFDLPAELRNAIYTECVEDPCNGIAMNNADSCPDRDHLNHCGADRSPPLAGLSPTALCRTSRRIRDEILPIFMASRSPSVTVSPVSRYERHNGSFLDTRIFTTHNKWLAQSSNAAYLRAIRFYGSANRKPTINFWVVLTSTPSGFRLDSHWGTWRPETVAGGYNLPALVRIIMLDKETVGLSMADVACIADFLGEKYRRWKRTTR